MARKNRSVCVLFFVEDAGAIKDLAEVTREFDQRATKERIKLDIVFPIRPVPIDDPLADLWQKYNPSGASTLAVFIDGHGEVLGMLDQMTITVDELIGVAHSTVRDRGKN